MQVILEIPDPQVARVIAALIGLNSVPLDGNGDPVCTDAQWAKEQVRRYVVNTVHRFESRDRMHTIQDAINEIVKDPTLAEVPGQDPIPGNDGIDPDPL